MMDRRLAVVLALVVCLRAYSLEATPYWHWDEGVNAYKAQSLLAGEPDWFGLRYYWVPHPPVYYAINAVVFRVFGEGIFQLRMFSVACSLASAVFIYLIAKELAGEGAGLASALLYGIYPAAIFWSRMAYSNNLVGLLGVSALYVMLRGEGRLAHVLGAGILLSACTLTEYYGFVFSLGVAAYLLVYEPKKVPAYFIACFALPLCFFAYMYSAHGVEFARDFGYAFKRVLEPRTVFALTVLLAVGYAAAHMFRERIAAYFGSFEDSARVPVNVLFFYMPLTLFTVLLPPFETTFMRSIVGYFPFVSLLGLKLMRSGRKASITWCFYFCAASIPFLVARADHMVIPAYPFFALGCGVFLSRLWNSVDEMAKTSLFKPLKLGGGSMKAFKAFVFYTIPLLLVMDVMVFAYGGMASNPTAELDALTSYVNEGAGPNDLVVTQSILADKINARVTTLIMSAAYDGEGTLYIRGGIPKARFRSNLSIEKADYILVPNSAFSEFGGEFGEKLRMRAESMKKPAGINKVAQEIGYVLFERV